MMPAISRRAWIGIAAAALSVFLLFFMFDLLLSLKKEHALLKIRQEEMAALGAEFIELRDSVAAVEGRKSAAKVQGIVEAVDETFKSVGLSGKVKSVKPLGASEKQFAREETAEVQIEKVTLNELANILYRIENSPMILFIRKTTIKTSFENPSLLNMTLTIGLTKPK